MNRRAHLVLGALFSFAFLAVLGCGGGDGGGSTPTNPGGSDPVFDLRFPATGVSQSFTFTKAGTWDYHCTPHSGSMNGTVIVDAGAPGDSAVVTVGPGDALSFSPTSVSIKPGGYVRWVNASSMTNHTVTRP